MIKYDLILKIIYSFYDVAKKDFMIGYHFRFIEDFDEHIPRIADFWNLQLNQTLENPKNLPFNLLNVHKPLNINKGEIFRWEKLFGDILASYLEDGSINEDQRNIWLKKVDLFKERLVQFL